MIRSNTPIAGDGKVQAHSSVPVQHLSNLQHSEWLATRVSLRERKMYVLITGAVAVQIWNLRHRQVDEALTRKTITLELSMYSISAVSSSSSVQANTGCRLEKL